MLFEERRTGRAALRLGRQLRSAHTTEEQRDHPDSAAAAGEMHGWLRSVVYHKKTGCAQAKMLDVPREQYVRCARLRAEVCEVFADIIVPEEVAQDQLPEQGVAEAFVE